MRDRERRQRGFTLQEMLIVVLILIVLLAVSIVGIVTYMRQLQLAERDNSAKEIFMAAQNRAILLQSSGKLEGLVVHSGGGNRMDHVDVIPGSQETTQITVYFISSHDVNIGELLPDGTIDPTLWEGDFYITYEPESGSVVDVFYSDETLPVDGDFPAFYQQWRAAPKRERMDSDPMIGYYGGESAQSGTTISLRTPVINIRNGNDLKAEVTYWVPRTLAMGAGNTVDLEVDLTYGSVTIPLEQGEAEYAPGADISYFSYTYTWTLDTLEGVQFREFFDSPGQSLTYGGDFTVTAEVYYTGSLKVNGARKSASDNSLFAKESGGDTAYIACLRHLQNLDEERSGVDGKAGAVQQGDIRAVEGYIFHPIENDDLLSYDGGEFAIYELRIGSEGSQPAGLFGALSGTEAQLVTLENIRLVDTVVSARDGPAGALVGDGKFLALDNCLVYWENQSEQATNLREVLGNSADGIWYQIIGSGLAGGLAGSLEDSDITGCSASTLVQGDTAGGLAGGGSGLTITGSYAASYLKGENTAGLVGNLTGGADIGSSYAVGFMETNSTAAGLCLGIGTADVSQSYSAMLFSTEETVQNYPLCQSGTYLNTHFLSSNRFHFVGDTALGVPYADLTNPDKWADLFGGAFAAKSAAQSHPYNLQTTLSLTTYLYPGLAELEHWGDWGAQFQNGSLVYYEQYTDGTYSFSKGDMATGKTAVLDGYAIAYQSTEEIVGIGGVLTVTYQTADGQESTWTGTYGEGENAQPIYKVEGVADVTEENGDYYLLPLPAEVVNTAYVSPDFYQKITIKEAREGQEGTEKSYYYNPHFANAILPYEEGLDLSALASRLQALVRTPRHLYQLSLHDDYYASYHQYRFVQQLDLDYTQYTGYGLFTGDWSQAPIGSEESDPFRGSYYGGSFRISGVRLDPGERQYVGLFGYSTGVLDSVVLHQTQTLTVSRSGSSSAPLYAGALAGYNGGSVTNCAAYGVELHGSGYSYSTLYLGGLVGLNRGVISGSAAEGADLTALTSFSHAYVGGMLGRNAAGGIVSQCYAVGQVSVTRARYGEVYACGFAGANEGTISGSYAAVALTAAGEGSVFGFCHDTTTGCYYLNEGNFTYQATHYTARYTDTAAQGVTWEALTGADLAQRLGMSQGVRADATGGTYPYPGTVTDADGEPVHYGGWPDRMALGPMGVYYWEALEINEETSYHFSVLSLENGVVEKRSTLSTVHGDGGVVTGYGYGYFYQGTQEPAFSSNGIGYGDKTWFTPKEDLENQAANTALADLMGGQYTFRSYDTWGTAEAGRGLFTVESGQAQSGQPPYGTWTLEQGGQKLTVRLNPFFADAMGVAPGQAVGTGASTALPGTGQNPYGVRSIDQLQFINWNYNVKSTVRRMDTGNMERFPYLSYGTNGKLTTRAFYWDQTHDLEGEEGVTYTPIAEVYDATTGNQGSLFGWFGGTYDGNDYLIADVNIKGQSESSCVGLFGAVFDATLKNIVLYSADGTATVEGANSGQSRWYAIGGLAGLAGSSTGSSVVNCTVAGYTIKDTHQSTSAGGWGGTGLGGLIGVSDMSLEGCTAVTKIELNSKDNDNVRVGGLVGSCQGSITNCYAGGSIAVASTSTTPGNRGIYIGGIVGGIYMKPQKVGGGSATVGQSGQQLQNTLNNCYTYVELPDASGNRFIKGLYAVGGSGDLTTNPNDGNADHGWTNYNNNYYLESVVLSNNGGTIGVSRNDLAQVTPLTYAQMADTDLNSATGLLALLNNNGGGFAPVTTQTAGGDPLAGRYSFGSDPSLLGRDYPFPTILTQSSDVAAGDMANVHYGDWPLEGIRRQKGTLPVNLDLFADYDQGYKGAVWTEQLTLSAVAGGGTWKADSKEPGVVTAAIDQSGNLTLTAKTVGSTVVTVTYTLGRNSYSLDIEVNVTAQLRLAAAQSPVLVFSGETAVTPLTLLDRDGETLPEELVNSIALSAFTVEYDAPYFTQAGVSQEDGLALTAQAGTLPGTTQMTVGYSFAYLGQTYSTTSVITLRVAEPEITLPPLEFVFEPDTVIGEQTVDYDGAGFVLKVDGAEQSVTGLTITDFEEVAAEFKDVIWVEWTVDDTGAEVPGSLSVTAYAQTLYPANASVRVQFQFQCQGSTHTLWQDLPVQVKEQEEGQP